MSGSGVLINDRARPWMWLSLAVAACVITWTYMHRVLLPWEEYVNVTKGQLKAQMGDLYPHWVGTRELLLRGRDPYGPDVSHEIQTGFYGHSIEQKYEASSSEIVNEQRFAYPVYVVFLLAPTVHADFEQLQRWAPIFLGFVTAISVFLWMQMLGWRTSGVMVFSLALFVLASPQITQGLRLRQLGLLVAFLISLATWSVTRQRYLFAGVLLAFSTIKPQMVLLCFAYFLLWSLGDVRKRWPLPAGFGITLGLLAIAGEFLVPAWPGKFLRGLEAYRHYVLTTSPLLLALGDWLGGALSILIVVGLITYAWRNRKVGADSSEFANTVAVFMIVSSLVLPLFTPYNQVLLLSGVVLVVRDWSTVPRAGRAVFVAVVAWPWAVSMALLLHTPSLESVSRLPLLPSCLVLLFPFLVAGLMYLRDQES